MDYNEIKQIIDDNIKPNTSQDITAIVANLVMTGMIDYTRDSIIDVVNQGFGAGAFTWLDVEHGAVIPYPQMSAGRARVVRIFKDNVEYAEGEATIGGVNGITIKHHALVICLEATNEMANDGMQETVGDRFAVINETPVLTNDDNTLKIDEDIIRLNVTNITEEFTANGTDRNFEMTNVYASIENVFINGIRIKSSDYITISEQEIEIKPGVKLSLGDEVAIQGTMFIE